MGSQKPKEKNPRWKLFVIILIGLAGALYEEATGKSIIILEHLHVLLLIICYLIYLLYRVVRFFVKRPSPKISIPVIEPPMADRSHIHPLDDRLIIPFKNITEHLQKEATIKREAWQVKLILAFTFVLFVLGKAFVSTSILSYIYMQVQRS